MPQSEYQVRFTAEIEQFAGGVNSAVSSLNKIPAVAGQEMRKHGAKAGDNFMGGVAQSFHTQSRHLRHVIHLLAGVLGGVLGSSFEHSFGKTLTAGLTGAMGGFFISSGSPWGALVGGLGAVIGHLASQAGERFQKLTNVSEKFQMSMQDIEEMAKKGFTPDEIAKSLERWNKLLDGIAEKNPVAMRALKSLGIEGADALNRLARQPAQRGEQALANNIISTTLPELGEEMRKRQREFDKADAIRDAQMAANIGSEVMPIIPSVKKKPITSESVDEMLKKMPVNEAQKFVDLVNEMEGGLDRFLKVINAGPLDVAPLSLFSQLTGMGKINKGGPGFTEKDIPGPDALSRAGVFLTGGVGSPNYQQTSLSLLSQIAAKVDGVKEAVNHHEQVTKQN